MRRERNKMNKEITKKAVRDNFRKTMRMTKNWHQNNFYDFHSKCTLKNPCGTQCCIAGHFINEFLPELATQRASYANTLIGILADQFATTDNREDFIFDLSDVFFSSSKFEAKIYCEQFIKKYLEDENELPV